MPKTILSLILALTAISSAKIYARSSSNVLEPVQTLRLAGSIKVSQAAMESVQLPRPLYIKNIVVQAQGYSTASTIEVMVNGQVKGTIYAPGSDPSYVVTIAEVARSIEFRHRDGGAMQILSVHGTVNDVASAPFPTYLGSFNGSREEVIRFAATVLKDIEVLSTYSSPGDDLKYLFPIKRNAGLVYVMATAHGTLSKHTIKQLIALCDQIAFAQTYLDQMMLMDATFATVVDLMTVREALLALLD